ncbi:hypothetical protein HPB47_009986 [Ixodes persulcatus]|uniref:Uncharacterized protein n=1 Tax=Ixodes persulcatus TaxID=34615 RepID=A0AC60P0P5_IXOPE|nr:hypothetical protein HPB47_009986 [Ixodes persulcatus]
MTSYPSATAYSYKGVIHGVPALTTSVQQIAHIESEVAVITARMMGKTETALITFQVTYVPFKIYYRRLEFRCYAPPPPPKPKSQQCQNCFELGHSTKVYPKKDKLTVCDICCQGNVTLDTPHNCVLYCINCRDDHSSKDPNSPPRSRPMRKPHSLLTKGECSSAPKRPAHSATLLHHRKPGVGKPHLTHPSTQHLLPPRRPISTIVPLSLATIISHIGESKRNCKALVRKRRKYLDFTGALQERADAYNRQSTPKRERAKDLLQSRTQGPNESVSSFGEDVLRPSSRADPQAYEEKKLRILMRGVKDDVFGGLVRNPPTTVQGFVTEATNNERARLTRASHYQRLTGVSAVPQFPCDFA